MAFFWRYLISFSFFLLTATSLLAQQPEKVKQITPEGDTIVLEAIPLGHISTQLEADYNTLQEISKRTLQTDDKMLEFDTLSNNWLSALSEEKKQFEEESPDYSIRQLNNSKNQWTSYEKLVGNWKDAINERLKVVEKDLYRTGSLKTVWEITQKEAEDLNAPPSVIASVDEMLRKIRSVNKSLEKKNNALLKRQSQLGKIILLITDVLTMDEELLSNLHSYYFVQDAPPIWNAVDKTLTKEVLKEHIDKVIEEDGQGLALFFESYKDTIFVHLFIFILLWVGFFILQKQTVIAEKGDSEHDLSVSKKAISRHGLSALVISMFLSVWLYPELNSTVRDVIQLAYIVVAIIFLPRFFQKNLLPETLALLLLFFLNQFQLFFPTGMLYFRLVIFAKVIVAGWILYRTFNRSSFISSTLKSARMSIVLWVAYVLFLFLVVSFLANIFGNLSLSVMLSNTVVYALFNLIVVVLVVIIANRSLVILLRTELVRKSNYINNNWQPIEKRTKTAIILIALFLWIKAIFKGLNLLSSIEDWLTALGQTTWKVGNSTIELDGVINFFLVVILTVIIYRIIKTLLEEELYPRVKLPRGVPGAISMITGYVIVAYGIYLSLSAAGVDLGQFGLIAGALGVGIGFGLQNIVANFIAGLILAFERPIQVGDTIEAGTVMGKVKEIGVRACTIRTFDGSEVMIPNGNLIANDVINWTLSDRKKRRDIFVSVAYGSNPHQVMELLKKVAESHPNVLQVPAPWILFDGFGDSALNFRVRIWTAMDVGLTTKSEVAIGFYDALMEAGIEIPFPQRDLHIKSFDPTIQHTQYPGSKKHKKD